jgi:hypothetical protein
MGIAERLLPGSADTEPILGGASLVENRIPDWPLHFTSQFEASAPQA